MSGNNIELQVPGNHLSAADIDGRGGKGRRGSGTRSERKEEKKSIFLSFSGSFSDDCLLTIAAR